MLFAAGLGTRLKPLTDHKPKALVEVGGVTLLEIAIRRLMAAGFKEVLVNVHHFASQVVDFLEKSSFPGIHIGISDERDLLLDTGGGLKFARWFFNDDKPFLACNVDVLTNMDLANFFRHHLASGALATLAIRRRQTSRYLIFDENLQLQGWQNAKTAETRWCAPNHHSPIINHRLWAFSGIQCLSPAIFDWMPEREVFSMIDVYLAAAASAPVLGFPHEQDQWLDVGTPESLEAARHFSTLNSLI
mgnify:CR=1 FL=1